MNYYLFDTGASRSFPDAQTLRNNAVQDLKTADVVIVIGASIGEQTATLAQWQEKAAVLLELTTECLGVYTGESRGNEGANVLGFARFRLGDGEPSNLVELVRQPRSSSAAIAAAQQLFDAMAFKVAVCNDFSGRIIDRLVRPYYNAALRRLDEGLATADDLDTTLRLGLGYPEGPIALLERTGLAHHFDVTQALFEAYGEAAYAPARRSRVAKKRSRG